VKAKPVKAWFGISLHLALAVLSLAALLCIILVKGKSEQAAGCSAVLEITASASGKAYGRWPLDEGGEFAIEFIHSVNQSPVREAFKAAGKEIRPVSVRFYSYGAGMQAELEEGQTLSRDNGALVISGFSRAFAELNYIVGTVSDHLLFINGETVSLRDLCGKNAHITLRIK
jgi:hypothetical protein